LQDPSPHPLRRRVSAHRHRQGAEVPNARAGDRRTGARRCGRHEDGLSMAGMVVDSTGELVARCLQELAQIGAHGETGVWRTAEDLVAGWSAEAGIEPREDAVGNVWGRLPGTDGGPVIASGSHIDSQTPGGRFDGALGVVAALVTLRTLRELHGQPRRTLE